MAGRCRHGRAGTPEYQIWSILKDKCLNHRSRNWSKVGGRGVILFKPWAEDFQNFYNDVGARPGPRHRLNRFPNRRGNFEPGNVVWQESLPSRDVESQEGVPVKWLELAGQRFSLLTVRGVRQVQLANGNLYYKADCECDCGKTARVFCSALIRGHTKSCGCDKSRYARTTGESHYKFKGYKEIRAWFWSGYIASATERRLSFEITKMYAWGLYEAQDRRCALSGVPLIFGAGKGKGTTTASIDRIDSSQGYTVGNIQWVHKTVNLMRNVLTVDDFRGWCCLIAEHSGKILSARF